MAAEIGFDGIFDDMFEIEDDYPLTSISCSPVSNTVLMAPFLTPFSSSSSDHIVDLPLLSSSSDPIVELFSTSSSSSSPLTSSSSISSSPVTSICLGKNCPSRRIPWPKSRFICDHISLAFKKPDVASDWDCDKNTYSANDYLPSSNKIVHWICQKEGCGNKYPMAISAKIIAKNPCPACRPRTYVAFIKNNVSFASQYPDLVSQFHTTLNDITPDKINPKSNKSYWWICSKGCKSKDPNCHIWQAPAASRASGAGCPYCACQLPCKHYNLLTMDPEIAIQWDFDRNGDRRPEEFLSGSGFVANWICPGGSCECHKYACPINKRVGRGHGCPICCKTQRKVCPHNGYNFGDMYPQYVPQWSSRNKKTPFDYLPNSNKKVWWICTECISGDITCHEWLASIDSRSRTGTGCPCCTQGKACKHVNLFTQSPHLKTEWDFERNIDIDPLTKTFGSCKRVWWTCPVNQEHRYMTRIKYRAGNRGTNCPMCKESRGETVVTRILTSLGILDISKQWRGVSFNAGMSYDFRFEYKDRRYIIEYDGIQHFKCIPFFKQTVDAFDHNRENDIIKHWQALKMGYVVVRIDCGIPFSKVESHILKGLELESGSYYSNPKMYDWMIERLELLEIDDLL